MKINLLIRKESNCSLLEKNIYQKERRIYDHRSFSITSFELSSHDFFLFFLNETDDIDKLRRSRWESLINILRMIKKPSWPRMSLYNGSASLFYRANRFMREVKIVTAILWLLWEPFLTTMRNNNSDMCNSCFLYYPAKLITIHIYALYIFLFNILFGITMTSLLTFFILICKKI